MDKLDINAFKDVAALLRKYGFDYLDRDGRLKLSDKRPVISIEGNAFDMSNQSAKPIVDPVIIQEFEKYFQMVVKGWPPERRSNIQKAKEAFFTQAEKNKYTQEFIDGFEFALKAYSIDGKEQNKSGDVSKDKIYFKNLYEWIPEWENWLAAYTANVASGQWAAMESGLIWGYLRSIE